MKRQRALCKAALVLVLALGMTFLCACGGGLDPQLLVQGNLDTLYLDSPSQEYLDSISNPEEAEESYEQGLEVEAQYFASYFEIVLDSCPPDTLEQIKDLYREIYSHSKYEVGEATQSGDTYLVSVTIYPIDIMQQVMDNDADAFQADYQAKIDEGYFDDMTDEEFETWWAQAIIDMVSARLDSIGYLEPQTISVQVTQDDDGYYTISENDFQRIDALIIQY